MDCPGFIFFFFNDPATPEISPLSLHDALPISILGPTRSGVIVISEGAPPAGRARLTVRDSRIEGATTDPRDRKSTRLNSSHVRISYAVFCLKKKKTQPPDRIDSSTSEHKLTC